MLQQVDMAGDSPGLFLLHDGIWDPGEAVEHRNLGCPYYDDCLDAALAACKEPVEAKRKGRRTWKLKGADRTWTCDPKCPYRNTRKDYPIEILKSSYRDE